MPTGDQFRVAADFAASAADGAAAVRSRVLDASGHHGIVGGSLLNLVTDAMAVSVQNAGSLEEQCVALAEECRRRASVCDEYQRAVAAYRSDRIEWAIKKRAYDLDWSNPAIASLPYPGREPSPPPAPEDWVDLPASMGNGAS